ncbi:MAG: hypothetical protein HC784_06845, partial [Hydrococcus sp. CSU_1_8]|nr:hypothetical protein [Hydrococcus sp. CSU_1_8]
HLLQLLGDTQQHSTPIATIGKTSTSWRAKNLLVLLHLLLSVQTVKPWLLLLETEKLLQLPLTNHNQSIQKVLSVNPML